MQELVPFYWTAVALIFGWVGKTLWDTPFLAPRKEKKEPTTPPPPKEGTGKGWMISRVNMDERHEDGRPYQMPDDLSVKFTELEKDLQWYRDAEITLRDKLCEALGWSKGTRPSLDETIKIVKKLKDERDRATMYLEEALAAKQEAVNSWQTAVDRNDTLNNELYQERADFGRFRNEIRRALGMPDGVTFSREELIDGIAKRELQMVSKLRQAIKWPEGRQYTYDDLIREVTAIADGFERKHYLDCGDNIAIHMAAVDICIRILDGAENLRDGRERLIRLRSATNGTE